jgi:pimeloyl-ACP methyl ester carboxylesterase
MTRLLLAVALLLASLAPAHASPSSLDQSHWTAHKKVVRLSNGIRLAYVELGDPNGEPLLLLHGYTDSSRSWSLVAPYLAKYRLLIPDQRGHGASDAPKCCYSASQFAYDSTLFLDALGVKRTVVAGHSLGSMVAIRLAAESPDRVSRIVLIGSTALVPVARGGWLYDNATALKDPIDPTSQFIRDWHPSNQPTPVDPAFAEAVNDELLRIPVHVWRGVIRELASVPVGRDAPDVRAPVLILSGGKDPLFPAEHHASLLKAFPGAQAHVFEGLGHNPNWERPEAVAAAMIRFVDAK